MHFVQVEAFLEIFGREKPGRAGSMKDALSSSLAYRVRMPMKETSVR